MSEQTEKSRVRGGENSVQEPARRAGPRCHGRVPDGRQQFNVVVRSTCWQAQKDMDIAEWIFQGRRLGSIGRAVSWWIGDWVNYGNVRFGEKYTRAGRITGYDVQSLMNMAYVAGRFDWCRRRESLSWSHHAELAGLEPELQDIWLDRAEAKSLSVRGLREELRTWRAAHRRELRSDDSEKSTAAAAAGPGETEGETEVVCPQCGFHITD